MVSTAGCVSSNTSYHAAIAYHSHLNAEFYVKHPKIHVCQCNEEGSAKSVTMLPTVEQFIAANTYGRPISKREQETVCCCCIIIMTIEHNVLIRQQYGALSQV